jgi:hypothetical protein
MSYYYKGHKIFKDYYKNDKARIRRRYVWTEIKGYFNSIRKMKKLSEEIKPLSIDLQMMLKVSLKWFCYY